jgi:hypothetical protein
MVRGAIFVTCVIQPRSGMADKWRNAVATWHRKPDDIAEPRKMKHTPLIAAIGLLAAGPALACSAPQPPASIPDGRTAGKEAMLAKKKEIDRYKRLVEEYLACEVNPVRIQTAQAELDRVAVRFNNEVRAFKAANGG